MALRFPNTPANRLQKPPPGQDPRESLGRAYLEAYLLEKYNTRRSNESKHAARDLPHKPSSHWVTGHKDSKHGFTGSVCIVGAGAAGLYIAMMLKYLGITNVDIFEANDHVGGRCATYTFTQGTTCKHNYYDMGAMRIPNIQSMRSTLNLIQNSQLLNIGTSLVDYVYRVKDDQNNNLEPYCYWGTNNESPDGTAFVNAISVPDGPLDIFQNGGFASYILTNYDKYSTRDFLMIQQQLSYKDTAAGELSDTSTGLFDQALTETLSDYTDFAQTANEKWFRVEGGMSVVTDTMKACLNDPNWPSAGSPTMTVTTKTPVIAMALTKDKSAVQVTTSNSSNNAPKQYDMVFNTTAMAPLQRMDLSGLGLDPSVLDGIRSLSYDRATKVAIKFKTRWWKGIYPTGGPTFGGVSSSDLPISNVVYPSWNDGDDSTNVLIVSYSWAQDASRMAALVPDYTKVAPSKTDAIVTVCLQDLVKLWKSQPGAPGFDDLWEDYDAHHAWAWSHDPYTGGAFALFGPGQFKEVYPTFAANLFAEGRLAICGEAVSIHHAWISGALDSAFLAVSKFLAKWCPEIAPKLASSPFATPYIPTNDGVGLVHPEGDETLAYWSAQLSDMGV